MLAVDVRFYPGDEEFLRAVWALSEGLHPAESLIDNLYGIRGVRCLNMSH